MNSPAWTDPPTPRYLDSWGFEALASFKEPGIWAGLYAGSEVGATLGIHAVLAEARDKYTDGAVTFGLATTSAEHRGIAFRNGGPRPGIPTRGIHP